MSNRRIGAVLLGAGLMAAGFMAQAEEKPGAANVIAISSPAPADDGERGSLNPVLSVNIHHSAGKAMDVTFRSDGSGKFRDIVTYSKVPSGTYQARPADMMRRGYVYNWEVVASDGQATVSNRFSFNLAVFVGPKKEVITHSDCWKYGYIKHGWEQGKFFVTTQRGTWAAYDLDKGWYRKYQNLVQREKMTGTWRILEDGGAFGHPAWGYWNGMYHALGQSGNGWQSAESRTFEGFKNLVFEKDLHDLGIRTQQTAWPECTTYTFNEDRAWIMAIDNDATNKHGNVKYWEWTKEGNWKAPVIVGPVTNHTGRVALVRATRDVGYVFVTEGGENNSTLKYFKSTDAGRTWGGLKDTGVPAAAIWLSSVSFARYGDNYYVFLSVGSVSAVYFTKDLENWGTNNNFDRIEVAGMNVRPHGTLLHPGALIFTVAAGLSANYDEQYGIIAVVPEMISHPASPTDALPANGAALPKGTTETELAVKVHGAQTYDVAFYFADGSFIGEDKLLREGDTARVKAKGLQPGKTCKWYAVARGALLEYYGGEPDATSDEKRTDLFAFTVTE